MATTVKVKFNKLPEIAEKVPEAVGEIITKGMHDMDAHATAATPVDTGALKASKQLEISDGGLHARLSWSKEYGVYVNFGTRKMAAQPFASDAVAKVQPSIEAALHDLESKIV